MVCVVLLSKLARRIGALKRPELANLPVRERASAVGEQTFSIGNLEALARRFTALRNEAAWTALRTAGCPAPN